MEDYSQAPINKSLSDDDKIRLYHDMVRIRIFEQHALQGYQRGKMGGFLHLYIGQEATAVGTVSLMGDDDHVITAYRDHGHALAVGMNMNECMAELYGKYTGCSKGKGGSMHFFAPDKNYWGGHGIVGGQTPLGAGIAYALKYQEKTGCCMCFLGDGAINQGAFHESLNLAALFDLPVVYIIENNGYSMGTSQVRSSAHPKEGLAARAEGYGMDWDIIDGSDLYAVRAGTQKAIERAHKESRPTLLEITTYRYYGHSIADANHQKYRTKEEIENYKKNQDPINLFEQKLIEEKILTEDAAKAITKEAKEEAKTSVEFADNSPFPPAEEIFTDVYWEVDNQTDAGKTGKHFFNSLES
ncbi:MAG: pyruvate dehydrogenase (acetyl-transferring) E1 component subunit alpha [Opitutales bacterium]|nr:pyruvate dehydrogenase (acetyl-transferring) E1 component subunit alpha [Opitutales bacterium]NRA28247.1 pyruvate dehydrogenase (acetyl-transferring) E1 component subunit alpha [Opitutales bacterium]